MPLTDLAIRNAKATGTLRKLTDSGGLQLWLMPTGSKLWRIAYRFNGKQRLLSLGPYPAVGLAEARQAREETKALIEPPRVCRRLQLPNRMEPS